MYFPFIFLISLVICGFVILLGPNYKEDPTKYIFTTGIKEEIYFKNYVLPMILFTLIAGVCSCLEMGYHFVMWLYVGYQNSFDSDKIARYYLRQRKSKYQKNFNELNAKTKWLNKELEKIKSSLKEE